jgi:two-component system LytT family sensor kinase
MPTRRWRRWQLIAGIWLLPGLYFAVQVYLQRSYENQPITIGAAFQRGLVFWLLWVFSSPLIARLARAYPFARDHWTDGLLLHLPAGTIFSLAHLLLYVLITSWLDGHLPGDVDQLLAQFQPVFLSSFAWWSLVYWTILIASYAFDLYERYQDGLLRASQLEAQLAQAELQALKMQLHPHFLFNTLNSIAALMHEDIETADRMIARLGDFLRLTLQNPGAHEVTLKEELKFLEYYLAIERLRFQDRLTTSFDVEPDALKAHVPNLLLQPIVENAIRHGVAMLDRPGRLTIRARRRDAKLCLEIEDNGPGLDNGSSPVSGGRGVGLTNTRARLEGVYGAQQRLELLRGADGGMLVRIEIPARADVVEERAEERYA